MPRGPAPGWFPDPHRRFAQRYWDGSAWTVHVADAASRQTTDPLFAPEVPSAAVTQHQPFQSAPPSHFAPPVQSPPGGYAAREAQTGPIARPVADAATAPGSRPAPEAHTGPVAQQASHVQSVPATTADASAESASAADETGELMKRLETALADYSRLLESSGPETDDADFARQAMKIGLIVRDTDAWILDAPSGRWFHYNGFRLSPLGGWNSRPDQE